MESSGYMGMVAVVAVSGGVALVALQLHKRLMVDFLKKVQFEIGGQKGKARKKVRFAPDVVEPSSNNEEYRKRKSSSSRVAR